MPKVPLYQGNQIKEADIPNVAINANTSVSNYKSGLDGALSQAPAVYDAYQEQKKKADQIAIYEADAKLSKLETSLLYDKDHGATNLKGKSSFSAPEIVSDGYNKGAKEIEDGLTNDDQKQSFAKLQLERGVSIDRTVQRHVGNEIVKYDNDTTSNFVKNEQDAAIAAYQDPARIALSIVRQKEAVQNYAERNGMPPEEATQKIADVESKTHAQVINRMLTNDQDVTADNYYKSNKDFIKGDDLAHVEKMIEAGSLRGKSQRFVDEAVKGGLSETAAIDKARSEFKDDPKLRDAAAERVRHPACGRGLLPRGAGWQDSPGEPRDLRDD